MNSDLIAWSVAIALGIAVVGLGWRRNLDATTRNWLPCFGEERTVVAPVPSADWQRRRPLSPRLRRWIVGCYLLMGLYNAASVALWADGRVFHAIMAVLFALGAVGFLLKGSPSSLDGSSS